MSTLVTDARVTAKWFLPAAGETLAEEALALLQGSIALSRSMLSRTHALVTAIVPRWESFLR